jgi:hypothetical protein
MENEMTKTELICSAEARDFGKAMIERFGRGRAAVEVAKRFASSVNAARGAVWFW